MTRRSRRKQNHRRQLRSNAKERERIQWKNCNANCTTSLNDFQGGWLHDNFLSENSVGVSCESDSDPEYCCNFLPEIEAGRCKSESALRKCSSDLNRFCRSSVKNSYIHLQHTFDTRLKGVLNESVSSTGIAFYRNVKNRGRTFSQSRLMENVSFTPRLMISEAHIPDDYYGDENYGQFSFTLKKNLSSSVAASEFVPCEKWDSIWKMSDYEESRELEDGREYVRKSSKNFQEEMPLSKKSATSWNNYSSEDSFFQMFENQRFAEKFKRNSSCSKENSEESKIFMECTKTEKHMLNCCLLQSEPKNKSTPIMKMPKQIDRKMSPPDLYLIKSEGNVSIRSNIRKKELSMYSKEETLDTDQSSLFGSFYASCHDGTCESIEMITRKEKNNVLKKIEFRDAGVQCNLLLPADDKVLIKQDGINSETKTMPDASEGDLLMKTAIDDFENKLNNVTFYSTVNMADGGDVSWGVNEVSGNDVDVSATKSGQATFGRENIFKLISKLLTKSSVQKIFRILAVLPLDKLLEFFCLTFSIPLIETMAISISMTKVMNILRTVVSFSNFNSQIKNYGSKAADYLKTGFGNFAELFVRVEVNEVNAGKECNCFCDVSKLTDVEKRLKNLENELTKFQIVDREIEKLKEIAKSLEKLTTAGGITILPPLSTAAPPPPPPPLPHNHTQLSGIAQRPPPPPPPPPPPSFLTTNSVVPLLNIKKSPRKQNMTSRPSITVEDLQKVTLRKVVANEKPSYEKKGPVVSLEMLRSVKLRSSSRKKSDTCSPTRTPTSRDRIRKIKSPAFRSSSRSSERKPRFSTIPLSQILNMDEEYHTFVDSQKINKE